jgi:hypothetical protein
MSIHHLETAFFRSITQGRGEKKDVYIGFSLHCFPLLNPLLQELTGQCAAAPWLLTSIDNTCGATP